MAAKPPKPPGKFLKQLNDCLSNNPKNNNNNVKKLNKANVPNSNKVEKDNNLNGNVPSVSDADNNKTIENCVNGPNNATTESTTTTTAAATAATETTLASTSSASAVLASKANCNCTNISIMHLFHEMKQEFPTIPDTIVAQCVNDNCHQRENCIQQLRNELALNPIPVQSYPAKVLHPLNQRQNCIKPLKPIRPAPVQPPNIAGKPEIPNKQAQSGVQFPINLPHQKVNCDSISSVTHTSPQRSSDSSPHPNPSNCCLNNPIKEPNQCNHNNIVDKEKDVENNIGECARIENTIGPNKTSDMPTTSQLSPTVGNRECGSATGPTAPLTENRENVSPNRVLSQQQNTAPFQQPPFTPRTRPNTLNLQTHDQQQQQQRQQRQQINIQLQKHFQQRNQQQQQQEQQKQSSLPQIKPLRKAPLPPIPPKPIQSNSSTVHSPQFNRSINNGNSNSKSNQSTNNNNSFNNNHNNSNNCGLTKSQQSSLSNESSLTSPTGSVGESEISVNVSLSSPIGSSQLSQASPLTAKSPRHRSVITVHPEPPYTKDFINSPSPSATGTGTGTGTGTSNATSPKSFTSVNLTLRQPSINSSIPASTIDISAGPGLSGNSSGLTYSSTSYDARRGYQKNFHITVTDQGGVFSASHIRPHSCHYTEGRENEQNGSTSPTTGNINPLRTATSEQCVPQLQQQQQEQQNQLEQQQHIVASDSNEMCVPIVHDVLKDTLERQKSRRDKLATALRDNKKRLNQVAHEINVLIEPISPEETERLDNEIQKLRCDCEAMLNEIDVARRLIPSLPNISNESWNNRQQLQQQPQPFPRQRHQRALTSQSASSAGSPRQPHLDFIQHHNSISPSLLGSQNQMLPPTYREFCQQYPQDVPSTDEEEYTDALTDADDDDDEEVLQRWACNMCTFRNHPQLNICECCENVRIPPGTIRIVPSASISGNASATTTPTPTPINSNNLASSIESDANLTQQFALHT